MIKSMTGYGRSCAERGGKRITVELRAVNNRFLDCTIKLPRLYTCAEDALKKRVQSRLSRGKVDVFVTVEHVKESAVCVTVNHAVAQSYYEALSEMARTFSLKDDISVSLLSRFPDVFTVERKEEDLDAVTADFCAVLDEALDAFQAMRAREGEQMVRDIRGRLATIEKLTGLVEERSPQTVAEYRARLEQRMRELLDSASVDEQRLLTEAAIFADKTAVAEETVRLRSHLLQIDGLLSGDGPAGRKLDFLIQELNREANTIGSKCNDLEISGYVVDLKAEIEKIREQVQNIE